MEAEEEDRILRRFWVALMADRMEGSSSSSAVEEEKFDEDEDEEAAVATVKSEGSESEGLVEGTAVEAAGRKFVGLLRDLNMRSFVLKRSVVVQQLCAGETGLKISSA